MIFGINTTSDISELLYVISRAVRRVKFETILKYHEWYLCQISLQIMLLFVYTTTHKRFVIFTCRYFKLSWNTNALSQSNCRNFSCSSIIIVVCLPTEHFGVVNNSVSTLLTAPLYQPKSHPENQLQLCHWSTTEKYNNHVKNEYSSSAIFYTYTTARHYSNPLQPRTRFTKG